MISEIFRAKQVDFLVIQTLVTCTLNKYILFKKNTYLPMFGVNEMHLNEDLWIII